MPDLNDYRAAAAYEPDPETIAAEAARIKAANLAAMVDQKPSRYVKAMVCKTTGLRQYEDGRVGREWVFRSR